MNVLFSMIVATAAASGGVAVLRWGWRRTDGLHLASLWLGWGGAVLAAALFSIAAGAEMGAALVLIALMSAGLLVVAGEMRLRGSREAADRADAIDLIEPKARRKRILRGVARVFAAVFLAAFAAFGAGVFVAAALPINGVDAAALGGLLVPPVWGGGMAWALGDDKIARPILGMAGIGAVGLAYAFWI